MILDKDVNSVTSHVLTEMTTSTPMLVIDSDGNVNNFINIDEKQLKDSLQTKKLID